LHLYTQLNKIFVNLIIIFFFVQVQIKKS